MRAGGTRQHLVHVPPCNTNVRRVTFSNYRLLTTMSAHSGYDRIKEDQASVPRPPSSEGREVVATSHEPHSTGETKRSNKAA